MPAGGLLRPRSGSSRCLSGSERGRPEPDRTEGWVVPHRLSRGLIPVPRRRGRVNEVHFSEYSVAIRPDLLAGLRSLWSNLAAPGTWWSGAQRVAIAAAARGGSAEGIPPAAAGAARTIYSDITSTSRRWVEDVLAAGLTMPAFVEVIGVVSRLAAVDEFSRALGRPLEPLPDSLPGAPSGVDPPPIRPGRSWVPMIGGMSITGALSLVPAEARAQEEIHGPLYMTYAQMADQGFERELTRPQMELVAGRVSAINECFY